MHFSFYHSFSSLNSAAIFVVVSTCQPRSLGMDRDIGQVPMKPAIRTKLLKLGYGKMNSVVYLTDNEILALSASS